MVPSSRVRKLILVAWLTACVGILIFAFVQRDIHDMPIAFTWLMILMSAPVGFVVAPIVGIAQSFLLETAGIEYNPFLNLLPSWFAMVLAGYIQWFIVVPRLFSWAKSKW